MVVDIKNTACFALVDDFTYWFFYLYYHVDSMPVTLNVPSFPIRLRISGVFNVHVWVYLCVRQCLCKRSSEVIMLLMCV